ncbi:ParA family protein [Fluoribacter gormanii]|jgi:chromosome partitioning protein|uniref:ParA family protein n=2 Tax=Fluoribacter TaxID=461 RepID=UPI0010411784|nr:ParA family protein [Fluoribacter gormanii]
MSGLVIAIIQKKGGATKTSTAINLMMALNELGYSSIACDMDKEKPDAIMWADMGSELTELVVPLFDGNPKPKVEILKKQYDVIVLDTPPNFEGSALKAAYLADVCIIPSSPSALDTNALISAAECALLVGKPYRFLASRIVKNTMMTKDLLNNLKETGESFETKITNSVNMTSAISKGTWVGSYMPGCDNHHQFLSLAKEVISLAGLKETASSKYAEV